MDYNDNFFEDDNFEDMEEKVRHYLKLFRNPVRNRYDFPRPEVFENLVDYCINDERYEEALEICGVWITCEPDNSTAFHKRAILLSITDKPVEAFLSIKKAISLNPTENEYLLAQAIIFEQLGNPLKGLSLLDDILKSDPGNEAGLLSKAMILSGLDRHKESVEILEYLENMAFESEEIIQELAFGYCMLENYSKSEEYYERAILLNPMDSMIWYNYGVMLAAIGANYRAIECYENALAIKEDFTQALFNLGNIYMIIQRPVESIESFTKILEYQPDDIDTLLNLASVYSDNQQYISAIEYFTKIIDHDQTNYQAFFGRGYAYDSLEHYDEALLDYNHALKYAPSSKQILQAKADLLYNTGRFTESLNVYLQVLEDNMTDEHSWYDAALLYFELDDYEKSKEYVQRAIDLSYSFSEAWYLLAKNYLFLNNHKKMAKCLAESVKLDSTKLDEFLNEFPFLKSDAIMSKVIIDKNQNTNRFFS